MVISSALLLARCCCIFMLLLSFANVAKYTNTALVSATVPSSSNARATPSNDPNEYGESDPCFLNQVAPKDGWTRTSKRSEGLCAYHLNFDQLDHEHLVQLNLSVGPGSEMTSGKKLQERRTTSTHRITTAAISGTGTPFRHAPKPPVNNNNSNNNDEHNNAKDPFGPESSLSSREGTSNASEHSPKPLNSHGILESNQTSDSSRAEKSADYSQRAGDLNALSILPGNQPDNASQGEILDNSSNDYDIGYIDVDGSTLAHESPTLKANRSDFGDNQEASPSDSCLLTLILQGPNEKQPTKQCIQNVSRENLIYYLRDVRNVTITWDRRFVSEVHLTYAMVPAKGVKCRINCGKNLCLLEPRMCESTPDCSDAANEKRKECAETRPSPQAQHEQSAGNIILIVMGVVVLIILVVCCCFLMRRNRCQLSRDALLRQQQRPHSHSSEMYRSPSGIIQDTSGQYDPRVALLHDRNHQAPSSHAQPSPHAPSSTPRGITSSHQQQPSASLPSHHHHAPLSPYFQPPQSSLQPCNGSDRQAPFLIQNMSKPSRSPHHMYPHQIAMSRDGEEGFKASQQALHSSHQQHQNFLMQTEVFRAPPNKTVFDRGSPPPPYSFKAPTGSKTPDLLVRAVSGVNVPRLVCSSSNSSNNNNNNNKHNNNNNMDKCKNQGSPPSLSAQAGSQVSYPPPLASIYPPNHLSASGAPPDYHQVAATRSQNKPSDLPVPFPSRQGAPPLAPTSMPSPESQFSPMRSSPIFCGFSSMADSSNTFVVTNGSPSVCPGPDRSTTTHRSPGTENGGDHGTESAQATCAQPAPWSSVTTVPSSQSSALSIETPLLTSSPTIISSSSPSSHVPVLLNLSLPSSSLSFSHGVDSGLLCASATTIATPALDTQAPGRYFNNNKNITINNDNVNNINDNHHHNNFNMNNLATGHCNVVNNNSSNNNNDLYCNNNNNNNNNSNDLECVANNCGVSSDDSPRLTPSKALLLVPTTLASNPSHVSTHLALITTIPFSSLSSLPPHHQHLQTHRHRPIHIQPTRQPQPSWQEACQGMNFNPASVQRGTSNPPQSPSPPSAVTNSEYEHVAQARSGAVLCSESNGNVFLGHDPLLSALATSPAVVTGVLDPNGNNSEGHTVRDSRGLPSSSSSSSSSLQGCPDMAMLDPNENCDWSKSLEALSRSPLVSSSVDPHVDSSPCCDNISAATTTTTTTTSSPSSSSPSSPTPSSSSTLGLPAPRNVDPGSIDDGDGDTTANVAVSSGRQSQENAPTAASQEEEQDVVAVVVVTKSRRSPTCTAAQERVE